MIIQISNWKRVSNTQVAKQIAVAIERAVNENAFESDGGKYAYNDYHNSGIELRISWK